MIVVVLTEQLMRRAEWVGRERERRAAERGWEHAHDWDGDDPYEPHIAGAAGEAAVATAFRRTWEPSLEPDSKVGDVGRAQVRSTPYDYGRLILHPDDNDEHPFVLVTGRRPTLTIRGWCYARDGKIQRYWNTRYRSPAYFVPQSILRQPRRAA